MREQILAAYGLEADKTALPLGFFEFAASTPYKIGAESHLWDVRVECHISPGHTEIIPCTMRICPSGFDRFSFTREAVLSNLSGRGSGLERVRIPFARRSSGKTELEWAGVSEDASAKAMSAFAAWCESVVSP